MKVQHKKRGRKSGEEVLQQVAAAMKNIQELELLEESPLTRMPAVRRLAETKYQRSMFPVAFALRLILLESVNQMLEDLEDMPNYHRELKFLQGYIQGNSVADISRGLGLSREHVARTVQPRALNLVARVFLPRANQSLLEAQVDWSDHSTT